MLTFSVVTALVLIVPPTVSAITNKDLETILHNTAYYGDFGGNSCGSTGSDTGAPLTGSDNMQKAFNYFKDKQLTDVQSAAIVANLTAESSVNPRSNQGGGGPGRGIAQWTVDGRWAVLTQWAKSANKDPLELSTQLDYLWMELNGTKPAGDYSAAFKQFKDKSSQPASNGFSQVEIGTGFFMGTSLVKYGDSGSDRFIAAFGSFSGFENPGRPHLDRRFQIANQVLKSYGSNTGDASNGSAPSVSGANAACGSIGAVDCTTTQSGDASSADSLTQARQNVVCLALAEVAKWDSGQLGPGKDYLTYSQGADQEWCADFVSYIFYKAGYPLDSGSKNGIVRAVSQVKGIGMANDKFTYHAAGGYTPVPGDIVVYQEGESHVNIVVSVNQNKSSMSVVGGNQSGATRANSSSKVTQYAINGYTGNHITGYVSPKE